MASASGRGDPYTPSGVRHLSRQRTPPSRDECDSYGTPESAGRGGGRVGVVGKTGLEKASLRPDNSLLSGQQTSFCDLRSESNASGTVAEGEREGGGGGGEDEKIAGLVLSG